MKSRQFTQGTLLAGTCVMAIILVSWVFLAIAFCLALLRAAARPLPPLQPEPMVRPMAAELEILPTTAPSAMRAPVHCTTV